MGYTTYFDGECTIDPPLDTKQVSYLQRFCATRRMQRDNTLTEKREDPLRTGVGLPVGIEGEFFVNEAGFHGHEKGFDVINSNMPPLTQPSLWCGWTVTDDGQYLKWDEEEKFYDYIPWLDYLITNFFKPWGCTLSGEITWEGDNSADFGLIRVEDNTIYISEGVKEYLNEREYKGWKPG